jgi:hypothetical protein
MSLQTRLAALITAIGADIKAIQTDSRWTNARAPTGAAGGDLGSTYPNPTVVKSNSDFTVGNRLLIPTPGAVAGILLGGDANLYRASADTLATDDKLSIGSALLLYPATFGILSISTPGTNPLLRNFLVSGDANATFTLLGDGTMRWGVGGATAYDVNLYRYAADQLRTDDLLWAQSLWLHGAQGQVSLRSQNSITNTVLAARLVADTVDRIMLHADGKLEWGPGGSAALDTNLYRVSAGKLRTDGALEVAGTTLLNGVVDVNSMLRAWTQLVLPTAGDTGGVLLGGDALLYRASASLAAIDRMLRIFDRVVPESGLDIIGLGPRFADATRYAALRWGDGTGRTLEFAPRDGANAGVPFLVIYDNGLMDFRVGPTTQFLRNASSGATYPQFVVRGDGRIVWGDGTALGDTNLYRSAADYLRTDDNFMVGASLFVSGVPVSVSWRGTWAAATYYYADDVALYSNKLYRRKSGGQTAGAPDTDTTNWDALTATGGGGGATEVYIGDVQPTRTTELIWIDTDEAGPATLNVTMDTWHPVGAAGEPVFQNSWVNYAAGQVAQFRKYPDGKVKLQGYIKGGATGTVVFTLPVGYRPPDQVGFSGYCSGGACLVTVNPDGTVQVTTVTGAIATLTSLDAVEFDTESVLQTVSAAAQPMDTWHQVGAAGEPAFAALWANFNASNDGMVGFRKNPDGKVQIKGIAQISAGGGTTVFTLPVGYRPVRPWRFCVAGMGGPTYFVVNVDGTVTQQNVTGYYSLTANAWYDLSVIEFDTESVISYPTAVINTPPIATSLPASPADGQEVYYLADATNGVIWHLRYRAGSSSAYKWEFLGGSPLESYSAANAQTVGAGSLWSAQLSDGTGIIQVALPLAGDYLAEWNGMTGRSGAGTSQPGIGVWRPNAGEPNTPSNGYIVVSSTGNGAVYDVSGRSKLVGCTVGMASMVYLYTALIEIFYQRRLTITPVRVG